MNQALFVPRTIEPERRRSKALIVSLSPLEHRAVKTAAAREGISMSNLVRQALAARLEIKSSNKEVSQ